MSRPRRRRRPGFAHYAAPAAFLLAVTIAVLLVRAGLNGGGGTTTTAPAATTAPTARGTTTRGTKTPARKRFYIVQSGDTFGSISAKTGVPLARLSELNPGVSSNSLHVGQRVRVK